MCVVGRRLVNVVLCVTGGDDECLDTEKAKRTRYKRPVLHVRSAGKFSNQFSSAVVKLQV